MLRRWSMLLVLTLGLPSSAYVLRKDSKGEVVRWSSRVEFVIDSQLAIQLGDSHTDSAVRAAIKTLDDATPDLGVSVRVGTAGALGYVTGGNNQNDILVLDEWPYDPTALAATIVTLDTATHEIIDADIVFNGQSHHFRVVDALSASEKNDHLDDIQNTLTHELGHALGLMHNADDATVVMYPSAAPLEISKRVLASDDLAGLVTLYGAAGTTVPSAVTPSVLTGCSAAGTGLSGLAWLAIAALPLLRRRLSPVLGLGLALAPLLARAEDRALDLSSAEKVSVAQVERASVLRSADRPGLLFTELTLKITDCVKGRCAPSITVRVPGGRLGSVEQIVAHQPVPQPDEAMVLVHARADAAPTVLRLHDEAHRARVRDAFARAGLAMPGSLAPQSSAGGPMVHVPNASNLQSK